MKRILIFSFLIFSFLFSNAQPKLVVGIVVDQMRYDYIHKYWNKFGNEGFKRLVNEGFECENTHYNYVPTFTGPGHSAIYTGATPSVHGIVSNDWINKETRKNVYCVDDSSVNSVGGSKNAGEMSPRNLLSSTIGEELKKNSSDESKVIGIALKDRAAILPAGHHANAAYWYDGSSGNWISSTYYMKELPQWVNDFNKEKLPQKYLSQTWNTTFPIAQYTESAADDNNFEQPFKGQKTPVFPYDLPSLMKKNGKLGLIKGTPFGNSLTKDFVEEAIKSEKLGKGTHPDFLCVSFSSTDYIGHQFGPQSVEVEDCYIRLDKDIADLLKFLDGWAGEKNVLVFLTADHGAAYPVLYSQKKNIPSGVIDEKTISDSLKKFFSRTYSDSLLLMDVSDFDVYLDWGKISEKKLSLEDVSKKTAQYLIKTNGIEDALTATELSKGNFHDSIRSKVKAGFYAERCGDIIFVLKPNWLEGFHKGTSHGTPYEYDTHVPLLWWGYTVKHGSSKDAVTITQIAATVSTLMKIPKPNGCTSNPISSLVK